MKISEKLIKKFQEGGQIPAEANPAPAQEPAPQEQGGQDPMQMIIEAMVAAVQNNDGQMALQACAAFLQLMQQAQGGGMEEQPAEPVFAKKGTKLVCKRRIKKKKC